MAQRMNAKDLKNDIPQQTLDEFCADIHVPLWMDCNDLDERRVKCQFVHHFGV